MRLPGSVEYTISGLAPSTYLCINVRAFNMAGESRSVDAGCASTSAATTTTTAPPSVTFCDREGLEANGGNCETFHESQAQLPPKYSTDGDIWSLRVGNSYVITYDDPNWQGFQHCFTPGETENFVALKDVDSFKFASSCAG